MYAVGFLVVLVNTAIAFVILQRLRRSFLIAISVLLFTALVIFLTNFIQTFAAANSEAVVVAVQPNVPMTLIKSVAEMRRLTEDHFAISENALNHLPPDGKPRLVIWPESPMYFSYGSDQLLRERIASFARQHRASVLLNSQEVAPTTVSTTLQQCL